MPIDYKRYPKNWLSEIRPRIMKRANNRCEFCGLEHNSKVWSVKNKGKVTGWYKDFEEANQQERTYEIKKGEIVQNPKQVKVVLTIAHLDHDEENQNVTDDRLRALCQKCHLRYDAKEKYRRSVNNNKPKLF